MNQMATEKQTSYIVSLYNRQNGTRHQYLSQTKIFSSTQLSRGITKAQASAVIDRLK